MKLLIATHNPAKLDRYKQLLKDFSDLELVSLSDIGLTQKIDEPFDNAKDNAVHKAKEYAKITGLPTLGIDEAVSTNFLPNNEQPGVYVRRYADKNHEMTDEEQLAYWKKVFDSIPQTDKQFIWDFQIAYFNPQTDTLYTSNAVMVSHVANDFSKIVEKGYPMSSFLIVDGNSKTRADLTEVEKLETDKRVFKEFIQDAKEWFH